jgi:PPP family 3-phenylpropionic acid transporter
MPIYWQSIGYSDAMIGALWSWSVAAEVILFFVFARFFGNWSAISLLKLSACASIARWLIYPLIDQFDLGLSGYFFVQAIHPFSIGLMLIGVQKLISDEISENRTGSAQGLAFLFNGLAGAAVTLVSRPLFESWKVDGTLLMAAVAGVAMLLIAVAGRYPQSSGSAGKTSEPS